MSRGFYSEPYQGFGFEEGTTFLVWGGAIFFQFGGGGTILRE